MVWSERQNVMHGRRLRYVPDLFCSRDTPDWQAARRLTDDDDTATGELKCILLLEAIDSCWMAHLAFIAERREAILLESIGGIDPLEAFQRQLHERFESFWREVSEKVVGGLEASNGEGQDGAKLRELQSSSKLIADAWTMILTGPAVPHKGSLL